jgi:hypothetical protein
VELLPLTFATGWASGLNAYATVLLLGLLGRFAHTSGIIGGAHGKGWQALRRWMARDTAPGIA